MSLPSQAAPLRGHNEFTRLTRDAVVVSAIGAGVVSGLVIWLPELVAAAAAVLSWAGA